MIISKIKNNKGFVILFAVTISAILLAIALGVSNIAQKQVNFSTSAKKTNEAFFAADTGTECALYYDKLNRFVSPDPGGSLTCGSAVVTPTFSGSSSTWSYTFDILGLGSSAQACTHVVVSKDNTSGTLASNINSKGDNTAGGGASCGSATASHVERELIATYGGVNNGPVGFWTLDDNAGTTAVDSSGNGDTLSFSGSPTWSAPGKVGISALTFAGSSWISCSDASCGGTSKLDMGVSDWTVALWYKGTGGAGTVLASKQGDYGATPYWSVGLGYGAGNIGTVSFTIKDGSCTAVSQMGGTVVNDGAWHHVAVTFQRSGNAIRYVDGVAQGSGVSISSCSGNVDNTAAFDVGARDINTPAPDNLPASGTYDDVRIYSRALTAAEISALGTPSNNPPTVNAGLDQNLTLPTNSTSVTGTATDSDGTIVSHTWSFFSGPAGSSIVSPNSYTTTINGLTDTSAPYVFKLTATDNGGAQRTDYVQITVSAANAPPTVTSPTATTFTTSGATLGANVTSLGSPASITERGTCWGTTAAPTTNCLAEGGTTTGVFTQVRTGMAANTTYFARGYAINPTSGTAYSSDVQFTTSQIVANDTFTQASDVTLASHTPTGAGAGTGWVVQAAGGNITDKSTGVIIDNTGNGNRYKMNNNLGSDQMDVQADFTSTAVTPNFVFFGLEGRLPSTTGSTAIEADYDFNVGGGSWNISDGTTSATFAQAWPGGTVTMKLQVRAGTFTLFANGVQKVSISSNKFAGQNYAGVYLGNFTGPSGKVTADNYLSTGF